MARSQLPVFGKDENQRISERVLELLEEKEGRSPLEFDRRLAEVIDPDALNALFEDGGFDGSVEFSYLGYQITVEGEGRIKIRETRV